MITKRIESEDIHQWTRKCDECGHIQKDNQPKGEMSDAYRERKCKKCKSPALDYGRENGSEDDMIC